MIPNPSEEMTWRDAPRCPDHEDYAHGCDLCFGEAVEGGVGWLVDNTLPGSVAVEMPAAGPGHRVFEVRHEGNRLFAVAYRQDGNGLVIPAAAAAVARQHIDAARKNVDFWDDRVEAAQKRGDADAEHKALQARGVAGGRLDRLENGWDVGMLERIAKGEAKA